MDDVRLSFWAAPERTSADVDFVLDEELLGLVDLGLSLGPSRPSMGRPGPSKVKSRPSSCWAVPSGTLVEIIDLVDSVDLLF